MSLTETKTHLISVLGAGGVGKTTTSAAIALELARKNYRVAVITVDPAKRLANALGLDELKSDAQRVYDSDTGYLDAIWINQNNGLSDLVKRRFQNKDTVEKLMSHRLFGIIESQLGGIEEYLGVERVLSLAQSGNYDVCVLDTPPSRHALDFFDSPKHILNFFDDGILKYFVAEDEESKSGFLKSFIKSNTQRAFDIFRSFLGKTFVFELSTLLREIKPLRDLLNKTAQSIESWIHSEHNSFVICATPDPYSLRETKILSDALQNKSLPTAELLILNKCISEGFSTGSDLPAELKDVAKWIDKKLEIQNNLLNAEISQYKVTREIATTPRVFLDERTIDNLLSLGKLILEQWNHKITAQNTSST